jgi:2-oxoisovalerate dehydrogenase E2 component (dihydrolipoyl transacylase)
VKKLYHKVGQIALVGRPLIDIEVEGEETKIVTPDVKEPVATPKTVSPVTKPMDQYEISDKVKTTPSVRRMARDENIDLTKVTPSGRDGRILKQDVMSFMENKQEVQKPTIGDREEPVRGLMRTMIKTMEAASQVPHLGYMDDIYMDKLIQARQEMNQILLKSKNKITFMPFFIKAASLALTQYPIINSQLSSDKSKITYKGSHNIGIEMDTKVGLLVPNIKNVQNLSLMEISVELNRLSALGEQGKLGEADLKGGTFSISNVGTIGGTYASPILVVPEVAICALGKMRKIPVFNEKNEVVGKQVVNISWSADHRIVDGATIARFSNALKFYIENPIALMTGLKNE